MPRLPRVFHRTGSTNPQDGSRSPWTEFSWRVQTEHPSSGCSDEWDHIVSATTHRMQLPLTSHYSDSRLTLRSPGHLCELNSVCVQLPAGHHLQDWFANITASLRVCHFERWIVRIPRWVCSRPFVAGLPAAGAPMRGTDRLSCRIHGQMSQYRAHVRRARFVRSDAPGST